MRSIWSGLCSALLVLVLATAAWAQNGLQRFENDIKPQLELVTFTYADGAALGDSGFVLNDVVAVIPANAAIGDKESTVRIQKVTVETLDFDRLAKDAKDDEPPRFAKIRLEGMTGDDVLIGALAPYGVPNVPVDVDLDYAINSADKVFDLRTLDISLRGQARIALSLTIDGVSDSSGVAGAQDDGKLRKAMLTLDDSGLLAKLLPAIAREQGARPDDMAAAALLALAGFADGQGPDTLKALDAVASFVADWKAPKGALVLRLKPDKEAGMNDLEDILEPNALTETWGFTATYAGTKVGAAKGGAAAAK